MTASTPALLPVSRGRFLAYGANRRVMDFASEKIGGGFDWPDDVQAIALQEADGKIVAAALFDRFEAAECQMHIATDGQKNWMARDTLAAVFAFPFWQLKLRRITAPIASRNRTALVAAVRLGFTPEGVRERALWDDDVCVLRMFRGECPWLSPKED